MKAISPKGTYEYIDEMDNDLPESEKTVFVCSHLDSAQRERLDDCIGVQTDDGFVVTAGKSNTLALHLGLKEVLNFFDEKGNPVELKRDQTKGKSSLPSVGRPWTTESLDGIPKEVRDRLAMRIKNSDNISEAEAKNS